MIDTILYSVMPKTKRCFKCGKRRALSSFYAHPQMGDGLLGKCKDCTKRDVALHIRKKRLDPEWLAAERARCVEKSIRLNPGYKKKNPARFEARIALNNAVQRGKLVKPTSCSRCKVECNPDGHHRDYGKPLEVVWLCRRCHCAEHGRLRKQDNSF